MACFTYSATSDDLGMLVVEQTLDHSDVAVGHEGVPSLLRIGAPSAHGAPVSIIRLWAGAIKGKIGGGRGAVD